MNRLLKKIVFVILLCLNFSIVYAEPETTTCKYDDLGLVVEFDEAGTGNISQTRYKKEQTPIILNWFASKSTGDVDIINELKHIDKKLYGSCPASIYACTLERKEYLNWGTEVLWDADSSRYYSNQKKVYLFYSEANMKQNKDLKDLPNKETVKSSFLIDNYNIGYEGCGEGGWGIACGFVTDVVVSAWDGVTGSLETYYEAYKSCDYVKYTGDGPTYNLACPNLNIYLEKFSEALNEYKKCSDTDAICISQNLTKVNKADDVMKEYCGAVLKNHNYDGGTEQLCLEACMDIAAQTKKAKVAAGIESNGTGECGVSERLIVWISNILRWVKYILPVIVIIFGILDFIKAMGADKEDEMKKAQGKFIKRLIAAALVFIIPLILEFILDKMGFGYDDCGLF